MLLLASCVLIVSLAVPSQGGAHCEIASLERLVRRMDSQLHNLEKAADFGCKPCHGSENVFIAGCLNDTIWRFNPNEVSHVAPSVDQPFGHLTAGLRTLSASDVIFDFVIDVNFDSVTIDYLISNPFQVFCTELNGTNSRLVANASDMPSVNFGVTDIAYSVDNDELILLVFFTDTTPNIISAVSRTGSMMRNVATFTGIPSKVAVEDGVVYVIFDDEIRTVAVSTTNGILTTLFTHYCTILVFDVLPMGTLLFMDDYGDLYSLDVGTLDKVFLYGTSIFEDPSDLKFNECDQLVYIVYEDSDQVELLETDGTLVKTLTLPFEPLSCPNIDFLPPM